MHISDASKSPALYISTPCRESWNAMAGDEKVRFCGKCSKNVFNLTAMTYDEQVELVSKSTSLPCVRAYIRPDRTFVFDKCPVPLRPLRDKLKNLCAAVTLLLVTCYQSALAQSPGQGTCPLLSKEAEFKVFGSVAVDPGSLKTKSPISVPRPTTRSQIMGGAVGFNCAAFDSDSERATEIHVTNVVDLKGATEDDRKSLASFHPKNKNYKWHMSLYGPVRWMDRSGHYHEPEYSDPSWKPWLDNISQQLIDRWEQLGNLDKDVTMEISLTEPHPSGNLKFTPDPDAPAQVMKQIIESVTGLDKGITLAKVLPPSAKGAEAVFLKIRLFHDGSGVVQAE